MNRILDAFDFLREWFPEGLDLSFLDPLVRLIGLEGNPEAGQLAVVAGAAVLVLVLVYLIQLSINIRRRRRLKREAAPTAAEEPEVLGERRSVEEIEAELERAVEELPGSEEQPAPLEPEAVPEEVETVSEPAVAPEPEPEEEPLTREGLFARLKSGLSKTKEGFLGRIDALVSGRKVDDELFAELEEVLIQADIGVQTTYKLLEGLKEKADRGELKDGQALKEHLKQEIRQILAVDSPALDASASRPFVILVCGVNGVGKTTTIGKLAKRFVDQGMSTMMVAGDTFRAAAIEQLEIWAQRVGADFIRQKSGADPSAVAFDGVGAAVSRQVDVVIVDTAGRLHTKDNLMDELRKVKRVVAKKMEGAPQETLLVLDATTGQNAIQQAKQFHETLGLTGIVLTKLDGTAKGGVIVGICNEMNIPIRFIGIGERLDDLREFNNEEFVEALFSG